MFSEGQTELSGDLRSTGARRSTKRCALSSGGAGVPLTIDAASQNRTVEIAYGLVPPVVNTDTFQ